MGAGDVPCKVSNLWTVPDSRWEWRKTPCHGISQTNGKGACHLSSPLQVFPDASSFQRNCRKRPDSVQEHNSSPNTHETMWWPDVTCVRHVLPADTTQRREGCQSKTLNATTADLFWPDGSQVDCEEVSQIGQSEKPLNTITGSRATLKRRARRRALAINQNKTEMSVAAEGIDLQPLLSPSMSNVDVAHFQVLTSQLAHPYAAVKLLEGFVTLAFDAQGCRVAQAALDAAGLEVQVDFAKELKGHIQEALRSPFANYVVQKVVELLPPSNVPFIIEELAGEVVQVAKHRYGVRILCRVLEHFPQKAIEGLIGEALDNAVALCHDRYGNYLMQHIMEYGTTEQCATVVRTLLDDAIHFAKEQTGSTLVERALLHFELEERRLLLKALIVDADSFVQLACSRYGCFVVKALLEFPGEVSKEARSILVAATPRLQTSKHAKRLQELLNVNSEV